LSSLTILNKQQHLFVEALPGQDPKDGDIVMAMQVAGYMGAPEFLLYQGRNLLKQTLIQKALEERDKYRKSTGKVIMQREELQEFWSHITQNNDPFQKVETDEQGIPLDRKVENIPLEKRLKASENLGKSLGIFIEKIDLTAKVSITDVIMKAHSKGAADDLDLEDIEAMYEKINDKPLPAPIEPPKKSLGDLI